MELLNVLSFFTTVPNLLYIFCTDTLLRKAFTSPSFEGYNFVSSLLVLLGLIKVCWIWIDYNRGTHLSVFDIYYIFPILWYSVFPHPLGFPEWGKGEACACGPWSPPSTGTCCSAGLLPQRECDSAAGLHVPVRAWQSEPISRHTAGI